METIVQEFMAETVDKFRFLEEEYGYTRTRQTVENEGYFPDARAVVTYVGAVIVEVYWYYAAAIIGVVFTELQNGTLLTKRTVYGPCEGAARAVKLYTLAEYLGMNLDAFPLKTIRDLRFSKIRQREKVINENMAGVLAFLAESTKNIAAGIIKGDTSVFPEVMKHEQEMTLKYYPWESRTELRRDKKG